MITLRQEEEKDQEKVIKIIEEAFKTVKESDHQEHFLVERLRKSSSFIPELSIVADYTDDDTSKTELVGHILFTEITIENNSESFVSLALAPVSVKPEYQNQGIGGHLIAFGHVIAEEMGYQSVVLIGHEKYYPKFGYKKASNFGISFPFEVPEENGMALELKENGLTSVKGVVKYPKEFEIE
ncbi:GNAT family N-acetyltransferase [Chryseobacterium oryctis]|uniref:N-acetyltransferase n=1 Tax=Chryseobacterium oryctis TaxID=2952618 RepID=A0ABT3HJ47_9FLAO|nr:N-acetyltransferase [Chryseobacterium oryctis]MCW3159801.1 N-acetyltransferase [Chryseobacterium oryctis]